MPPRGPITISKSEGFYLLNFLKLSDNDTIENVINHLELALLLDQVTILLKEDEAETILDMLPKEDKLRDVVIKCINTMRNK